MVEGRLCRRHATIVPAKPVVRKAQGAARRELDD
jgi:hypothetical protein